MLADIPADRGRIAVKDESRGRWRAIATVCQLLLVAGGANALSLTIEPPTQTAPLAAIVSVDLVIGGLTAGGPSSLGTFDLDIGFDDTVLTFQGATFGGFLGTPGVQTTNGSGLLAADLVDAFEVSLLTPAGLDALQPASFTLATLFFWGAAPGTSPLTLTQALVGDAFGTQLLVTPSNASITIVPEPATIFLMGLGLVVLGVRRRA